MIDWTVVSSIATSLAFFGVAWQAFETRKTAGETRKAATTAAASLETSRGTLQISRDVAMEAVKTRLDARAPRLTVSAAPTIAERARQRALIPNKGDLGIEWAKDTEFRRTEDDDQRLLLGAQFEIENEGASTVEVQITGPITWLRPEPPEVRIWSGLHTVSLKPGKRCEFRVDETRSLAQWAEAWESRSNGNSNVAMITAQVICSDPYDDGVVDHWSLEVWGYPVEPKPNDLAAWRLRPSEVAKAPDPLVVTAKVSPQKREYFFSKEDGRRIPSPALSTTSTQDRLPQVD